MNVATLTWSSTGPNWINDGDWLSTNTPCSWFGIECNYEGVEELHLDNNNLRGEIPSELGRQPYLEVLYLSGNELSGPIPPELGDQPYSDLRWGRFTRNG